MTAIAPSSTTAISPLHVAKPNGATVVTDDAQAHRQSSGHESEASIATG